MRERLVVVGAGGVRRGRAGPGAGGADEKPCTECHSIASSCCSATWSGKFRFSPAVAWRSAAVSGLVAVTLTFGAIAS